MLKTIIDRLNVYFNLKSLGLNYGYEYKKAFVVKYFLLVLIIAVYIAIIISPFLVKAIGFDNWENAEFIVLILLLSLGFFANHFYKNESKKYEQQIATLKAGREKIEERLENAFKYIGSLNVQIEELESIFTTIKKYPETKNEIKKILTYFTEKILSIVNAEWALFRVVDVEEIRTLTEVYISRNKNQLFTETISNINLINNVSIEKLNVVSSTDQTFRINTYCIFPAAVNKKQKIMIETIANQAEMLYIIYSSIYYKNNRDNL